MWIMPYMKIQWECETGAWNLGGTWDCLYWVLWNYGYHGNMAGSQGWEADIIIRLPTAFHLFNDYMYVSPAVRDQIPIHINCIEWPPF